MEEFDILSIMYDELASLDDGEGSLRDVWMDGIVDGLDPVQDAPYAEYRDDPIGFCEQVLGIRSLTDDQKRMLNSIRDNEVTVVMSATGVGKTFIMAAAVIWLYKCYTEVEAYTAAAPPEGNLKRLLWGELNRFVVQKPKVFLGDNIKSLMVTRAPKQHIEGVTIPNSGKEEDIEARFSGKHQDVLAFFFDEGDAIPEAVYRGADGCMSGGRIVRMVICYNPRHKSGYPYKLISEKMASVVEMSAFSHPNVITGKNIIPGAVTRAATVRRINEWTRPLSADEKRDSSCYDLPDFLVGAVAKDRKGKPYPPLKAGTYKIIDSQFSYKVIGQYPASGAMQLFDEIKIEAALSRWQAYTAMRGDEPPKGVKAIMGGDVADLGPDSSVAIKRYGGYVTKPRRRNGVDAHGSALWFADIYKQDGDIRRAYIDAIGVGAGVAPLMFQEGCLNAIGVRVNQSVPGNPTEGTFAQLRDYCYWLFRKWLHEDSGAMLPYDERLLKAMRIVTYDNVNGKIKIMRKKDMTKALGFSPDEMEALMLTHAPPSAWMGGV
jgi:hypothetical protein